MTRTKLLVAVVMACLSACVAPETAEVTGRDDGLARLALATGGPITVEMGDGGTTRTLAMTERHLSGRAGDPAAVATKFLADYADVFGLDSDAAASFAVVRADVEPNGVRHVVLQRHQHGEPVAHGTIAVHLDRDNGVFRVVGDSAYLGAPLRNTRVLTPEQAGRAAATGLGVAGDATGVTRQIVVVAPDDARFAYEVTLSWHDDRGAQHLHAVVVDAASGALLASHDLVENFTGRVYTASPGAAPTSDGRTVVSFDGDVTASPSGWVGSARTTTGNNAAAATDLDGNNSVGSNEIRPAADASDAFDFPMSPSDEPSTYREAAVANAFYLVNDWHDRAYKLGFTESAGNFQSSNFGNGGGQNDEVQIDVQDGAGTDNANFATPPDGQRPRMQLFVFDLANGAGGVHQDSALDPSVVYHEQTHGLSNRTVGGGSTGCLVNLQSAGMGEGWSDFMAASFLGDPVVGAYVTGNAATGIRRASMANSPFTYGDIQDRELAEVHDVGEMWAAALWDIRTALGAATTEQLVVSGMKLTPCRPTMVDARDAILAADAAINAGANRCALYTAFAGRLLGTGASSPNDTSTTQIVTSADVPADCGDTIPPGGTKTFTAVDVPKAIPDNDPAGATSVIHTRPKGFVATKVLVTVDITHTYRGDLVIQVIAPDGQIATLADRTGGSADDFHVADLDITSSFAAGTRASGTWKLFVRDTAIQDTGEITGFSLTLTAVKR
jgi:hypothetical protein